MIKELNKEDFTREVKVPALRTLNAQTQTIIKLIRNYLYDRIKVAKVQEFSPTQRIIALLQNATEDQFKQILKDYQYNFTQTIVKLTYENFTTSEIFNYYYPQIPSPNSFETIAHIAHYNLTEEQIPYGKLIGDILLLKNKLIKTVVNKTEKLHNVYRTPVLVLLAGDHNYQVEIKEQGTRFAFNFEKVYWCSRLQTERDRLLQSLQKGQTLLDIFCGVGPLAVRAARKGLNVIANDLNPQCYKYLVVNAKLNKVEDRMLCYNGCARETVRKWYNATFVQALPEKFKRFHHVYMNLPVDAIQFLDVFRGFLNRSKWDPKQLPMIHINGFVVADNHEQSLTKMSERIKKVLPHFKKEMIVNYSLIKNVTIIMRMYCLSFRLSQEDARAPEIQQQQTKQLDIVKKKVKID